MRKEKWQLTDFLSVLRVSMNFENFENSLQSISTWVTSGKPSYVSGALCFTTLVIESTLVQTDTCK